MAESTRPELFTSPATGQQRMLETRYDDAPNIDPQALQQLFQSRKIAEAEKAMAAAIQFQGLRGYQNALQSGKPAAEALTRYGPMMFYTRPQAFGPAVRAITPPEITPYQQEVIRLREAQAGRPQVRAIPGGGFVSINPTNQAITTIREPTANQNQTVNAAVEPGMMGFPPSRVRMNPQQFQSFISQAPPEVQTNAVNTAISRMLGPAAATTNAPSKKRLRWNVEKGDFE